MLSTNSALAALSISSGTLTPVFSATTTSYTVSLTGVPFITLTPTASDGTATIQVNGSAVNSGNPSSNVPLTAGSNTINVLVTAQDDTTTTTYKVTVNLVPSNNAYLTNLVLNSGTLTPAFAIPTINYAATVSNATTSLTVTPTTNNSAATVQINGLTVTPGTESPNLPLSVGLNTITTVVTAQDGITKKTYSVVVNRLPSVPSSNSSLAGLTLSSGTLSPVFAAGTTTYTASVNSISSLTVTPVTGDVNATVQVNGVPVISGSASAGIPLVPGANTISTVVTAPNGTSKTTYKVTVTLTPSANANLIKLALSSGTLTPAFAIVTGNYTAAVSNATTSVTVTPTTNNSAATVQVNGITVVSGTASPALPLAVGNNTITTIVTAQNGITTKTYTVTVIRYPSSPSTNSSLSGLSISSGTLSPAFSSGVVSYSASVQSITAVTVKPTTSDGIATVTVNGITVPNGMASPGIPLVAGPNTINTVVTAQDGVSTTTYTVIITMIPSNNAYLTSLQPSSGTLSPVFDPLTMSYTASVSNATTAITVTPVKNNNQSVVTIDGALVAQSTPSASIPLVVGSNTITAVVTAQDGVSTNTYTITVTRASGELMALRNLSVPADTLADGLLVHPALSPNGDGVNDYLVIDKITDYPDNTLKIMDRNGVLVYEAKGYDNASRVFDGHSSKTGIKQLPGTYFYSLQYKAGSKSKYKTGYLVIKY